MDSPEGQIRQHHGGRTVLVVEDEPVNCEVARCLLEEAGLQVQTAGDGRQAIDMATARPYAAILMDMQMPVVDGLEATRRIRALAGHADTPIIAMTANVFADDRALCLDAGMSDFLAKPIQPAQLFSSLLRWLDAQPDQRR